MTPAQRRIQAANAISDAANGVSSLPLQSPQPAPTGQAARAAVSTCDLILGSDAARAVGRFNPNGTEGYRSKAGGPVRATRAEAEGDYHRATCDQCGERPSNVVSITARHHLGT
jgi:hypothetical protein